MSSQEDGTDSSSEESTKKRRGLGEIMSDIFLPMLPALIGAGILQGITSVLVALDWLSEDTSIYTVLTWISSAIFYFLPFLIAGSTAKAFDTSPYLAIGVVAFFLYPDTVDLMAGNEDFSLFGIPVVKTTYTSSVIPIILMIWGMSYIHRWTQKLTPKLVQTVLVPTITIGVTCILGLLVVGPIGNALTEAITWVVTTLNDNAPWIVPFVVGLFGALLISIGMSFALLPIAITAMQADGYDSVYGPGMLASNLALAGMALAVALKARDTDYKTFGVTASVTAMLGVAQPALYGVAIALRKPFIGTAAGGACGGLLAGLTGFKVYGLTPAGLPGIPVYVGDEGAGNLLLSFLIMIASFGVAFVVTWVLGYEQPTREQVDDITGEGAG